MAGFTGFPFPNKTFPSSSSTPMNPLFGSSSSSNGFSSTNTQANDEATIKKILEAIEILEKLANNGGFPKEKLQEIKKEVEKMYPNLFSAQNPSNNDSTPPNNTSSFQGWENYFNNNSAFTSNLLNQQQEFYNNYQRLIQQQVNYQIQAQNQMMEQYMKMFASNTPNYYPIPSYGNNGSNMSGDVMKIALEMMGKSGNDGLYNNLLGNNTSFGGDGFGALSFLGNLLGGFGF